MREVRAPKHVSSHSFLHLLLAPASQWPYHCIVVSRQIVGGANPFESEIKARMNHPRPATLGQLKETGYRPCSVKDELRRNLIRKLKAGEELFPGIVGYRDTSSRRSSTASSPSTTCCSSACAGRPRRASSACCPTLLDEWMPVARRRRDQRRSDRADDQDRQAHRRRAGRRREDRMGPPRRPLPRKARDAGRDDRRPDRRDRPGEARRGALSVGRIDDALRPDPAQQSRHLRDQRTAGPRAAHPGRPVQRAGRARRADPRLSDPARTSTSAWSSAPIPRTTPTAAGS